MRQRTKSTRYVGYVSSDVLDRLFKTGGCMKTALCLCSLLLVGAPLATINAFGQEAAPVVVQQGSAKAKACWPVRTWRAEVTTVTPERVTSESQKDVRLFRVPLAKCDSSTVDEPNSHTEHSNRSLLGVRRSHHEAISAGQHDCGRALGFGCWNIFEMDRSKASNPAFNTTSTSVRVIGVPVFAHTSRSLND